MHHLTPTTIYQICGETKYCLTHAHMRKHGITKEEYLKTFPEQAKAKHWGELGERQKKARL